jgi:hypothetical protein
MQVTSKVINGLLKVVTKSSGIGGCHLLPSATCSIFYGAFVVDHLPGPMYGCHIVMQSLLPSDTTVTNLFISDIDRTASCHRTVSLSCCGSSVLNEQFFLAECVRPSEMNGRKETASEDWRAT